MNEFCKGLLREVISRSEYCRICRVSTLIFILHLQVCRGMIRIDEISILFQSIHINSIDGNGASGMGKKILKEKPPVPSSGEGWDFGGLLQWAWADLVELGEL